MNNKCNKEIDLPPTGKYSKGSMPDSKEIKQFAELKKYFNDKYEKMIDGNK